MDAQTLKNDLDSGMTNLLSRPFVTMRMSATQLRETRALRSFINQASDAILQQLLACYNATQAVSSKENAMGTLLTLLGKLSSVLAASGLSIGTWILAHQSQFQKALTDLLSGQPLTTVFADLLAATGLKAPMQAMSCEDCCCVVSNDIADALKALHKATPDRHCATESLSHAIVALCSCE